MKFINTLCNIYLSELFALVASQGNRILIPLRLLNSSVFSSLLGKYSLLSSMDFRLGLNYSSAIDLTSHTYLSKDLLFLFTNIYAKFFFHRYMYDPIT